MSFEPQKLKLETLKACPICGDSNIFQKFTSSWYQLPIRYCQCQNCGTLFLSPRMTDEQTTQYYKGPYRDLTGREKDIEVERSRAKVQLALIKPYLNSVKTNLEIGSSAGALIEQLNELGIKSIGIEPEARYQHLISKKFKVYNDIAEIIPKAFDLISSSHTIEHLNHPLEYYDNLVRNYSHEKTIFMVETPNADQYILYILHHPFAFNQITLDGLFARIGLKPIKHFYHSLNGPNLKRYLLALYRKEP